MATYLEVVNKVLVRLNEVPLTQDNFAQARGIHKTVIDVVSDVVNRINAMYPRWPWLAREVSVTLTPGVSTYNWPQDFVEADWYSFFGQGSQTWNLNPKAIRNADRNAWYPYERERIASNSTLRARPEYVMNGAGMNFQIGPIPDRAYIIGYRYYAKAPRLSGWADEILIPDQYDYIIVEGALAHLKTFKADIETAQVTKADFTQMINELIRIYAPNPDTVRTGFIHRRRY